MADFSDVVSDLCTVSRWVADGLLMGIVETV